MRKHVIQMKNVNKCQTYFLSGEIKELKKKKQQKTLIFVIPTVIYN